MLPTSFPQTPTTRSTSSWLGRGSDDLPGLPDLSFAKTRSWHWTSGWHRATLERNVPRTRSLGRRACSAQDPYQSRAGEPGAPAATRSAPPPLEATAVRAPRSRVLGLALSAVGRLAEGALRRSPRDRDSLASAGLSRFLDLEVPTGRTGRPPIGSELADLIRTVAHANLLWGAPRIHGELLKLGFEVSQRTVARLMPRRPKSPSQTWRTFLQNHVLDLVSVDFFVVPTATFRMLYVFVVLRHHRRKVVHFNVTDSPTAAWTAQQIVEAFPDDSAPRYLLRDRDRIYGDEFRRRVQGIGIAEVLAAPRSPWQNPFVERVIGTIRRELLDYVIVVNEDHLRRRLRRYVRYYNSSRTHLALDKDAPEPRDVEPPDHGRIVALPLVGGLHHRYVRRAA